MQASIDPCLTRPDLVVLKNLLQDIDGKDGKETQYDHNTAITTLEALNNESNDKFDPTVFTTWDLKDIRLPSVLDRVLLRPYIQWARTVVRRPTDVVFLTHIIIYFTTVLPSAIFLYYNFSWLHAIAHLLFEFWCCGAFTLLMHNHIHNNGVLSRNYALFDRSFPYILEPLMGHTWDSYYYHHVKHHHVEGNGPDDLSSTIRYQRDELLDFLMYFGRFFALIWVELPLYFWQKKKFGLAVRAGFSEVTSYLFMFILARYNFRATMFVLIIPFLLMRLGLMVGNWGQHAFVDELEPDSDFRSSITLIDVPSNRYCFNDGYHTAHHLNPRRHWRDQPLSFLKSKEQYQEGRALVFRNIDYLMITVKLIQKDYDHLARCLVPIGPQIGMSQKEIADMLRTKTKRFSEADIAKKFRRV